MKILFCCQHYCPYVSGVARVVQEWAEYLVQKGHEVTVATSKLSFIQQETIKEVEVYRFDIYGNEVRGFKGKIDRYQKFILDYKSDVMVVYAAEQWTFDCLFPILEMITAKKVHVPCGYASYNSPAYRKYYKKMADVLKKFDMLVYHANKYRDIDFARKHGLENLVMIPNGASEDEFNHPPNVDIRKKLGIAQDEFMLLAVGSPPFLKGHWDLIRAYERINFGKASTLVLNGYYDYSINLKNIAKFFLGRSDRIIRKKACKINENDSGKNVIIANLKRDELISAYFQSDLFVMASHVEYSPLVLFEASAAGLPYVALPVGNANEITDWTGGGVVVDCLESGIGKLVREKDYLDKLGKSGRDGWKNKYTWKIIAETFEKELIGLVTE